MGKNINKTYFTFRKEIYNEVSEEMNKIGDKVSKYIESHTKNVKGIVQGLTFTAIINILIYNLVWFKIISGSVEEVKLKGIILFFSIILLMIAPLSKWIFPDNFNMKSSFSSAMMTIINQQTAGFPIF